MKKVLHIISHTHWDREWYMSFEKHRMRLVELMDTIIEKMEKDENYKFFHLDGQTIIIDDYLEVKPQMRDRLYALINAGRIQVGPWYILQDEYLTSGESNIRNMIEGLKFCKQNGIEPVMSGYMPDAFGNISQMPQILDGFGIDNAIFGRGQGIILFDNKVPEGQKPADKELWWQGADGTSVIGVMFGDWYNNANELPCDEEKVADRYSKLINWLELTAKTPHLLGMNGCDHQPIQFDLPESIEKANKLFGDDVEIKHSNFKDFVSLLRPYSKNFTKVEGELASQHTSGWCRLVDTASTHIPLKQQNYKVQNMLTFKSEPISSVASLFGDSYRKDMLRYAWKTLMQCHPHDSICCCSCDAVTKEMSVRFDKAYDTADYVLNEAMEFIANNIDTSTLGKINIVVMHTSPLENSSVINTKVYSDELLNTEELCIVDASGNEIPCEIKYLGEKFTYTLPKDSFRKVKYRHCYDVAFPVRLCGIGYFVYSVKKAKKSIYNAINIFENGAETDTLKVVINTDGTLDVTEKQTGKTYTDMLRFEDTGDCGESYNYIQTKDNTAIFSKTKADIKLIKNNDFSVTFEIISNIEIPSGLCGKDSRSTDMISHEIISYVTLTQGIDRVDIKTIFTNKSENHRLRVLFPTNIDTDTVMADGQFDVIKRNIKPWEGWENPSNTQRMQAFFGVEDKSNGVLVASRGLCEYEVLRDGKNTMALTLLRAVGEVGDWGVFPTPEMQLKKELCLEYSLIPYSITSKAKAFNDAYTFAGDFFCTCQTEKHAGDLKVSDSFITVEGEYIVFSALKKAEDGEGLILRIYNVSDSEQTVTVIFNSSMFAKVFETNLAENKPISVDVEGGRYSLSIPAKKIRTFLFKKSRNEENK